MLIKSPHNEQLNDKIFNGSPGKFAYSIEMLMIIFFKIVYKTQIDFTWEPLISMNLISERKIQDSSRTEVF